MRGSKPKQTDSFEEMFEYLFFTEEDDAFFEVGFLKQIESGEE